MNTSKNKYFQRTAKKVQNKLIEKYNVEIELGATIGIGIKIHHYSAIIITRHAVIGKNFTCYQNVTIGWRKDPYKIKVGDNATIGCGATILGGEIEIGNNVKIGAMSLVISNIPDNCTYTSELNKKIISQ
ncbi:serine acetyltransferase [Providencia rettgeri]|nr:serine acetyltransferase [Providencia rettgeri]